MKITISGKPGSGKSTVAKRLAKKLGLKHYSMGDLQRKYAKEKGLTIEELGELEAKDDKIDRDLDSYQSKLKGNFIIDGRMSFHFIQDSFKIFLDCNKDEGAKRIFSDTTTGKRDSSERKTKSLEESKEILVNREEVNRKRFLKYYKGDFLDKKNYDLVVDTTKLNKEDVVKKILQDLL